MDTTAESTGLTFRLTMVWAPWMTAAAQTTGSIFPWGMPPWPGDAGHNGAVDDRHGAGGEQGLVVGTEEGVHPGVLQGPGGDEFFGPYVDLLRRLEEEFDAAVDLVPHLG